MGGYLMYSEYLTPWKRPDCYGGFSPDGEYVILTQCRDSDALERSNYRVAMRELERVAAEQPEPKDGEPWVYDFRAGHWGVGWIETLMVRDNAPEPVIRAAEEIVCALADYPVLDDSDYSELEFYEASEYWASMSVAERFDMIARGNEHGNNISLFAARCDAIPQGDNYYIWESLTRP